MDGTVDQVLITRGTERPEMLFAQQPTCVQCDTPWPMHATVYVCACGKSGYALGPDGVAAIRLCFPDIPDRPGLEHVLIGGNMIDAARTPAKES